ncbi:MAG: hypothetical protein QNL88_01200, partial [Acidobacteriota bacterium]|nr:hypothetical protein [Acidobacteriota bacterium]
AQAVRTSAGNAFGLSSQPGKLKWKSVSHQDYEKIASGAEGICCTLGTTHSRTPRQGFHGFFLEVACHNEWTRPIDIRSADPVIQKYVAEIDSVFGTVFGRYMEMGSNSNQ